MFTLETLVFLQKTLSFMAMALLAAAAYTDVRTFRIPNLLVGAVAALGIVRLVLLGNPIAWIYAGVVVVLIFTIGLMLFSRGIVGGGDVKLLTATILMIRYPDLLRFFALMSVVGALLSLAALIYQYLPLSSERRLTGCLPKVRLPVPYGVAIATAGIVSLLYQPLLFRYGW